jgi:hypothetical protein
MVQQILFATPTCAWGEIRQFCKLRDDAQSLMRAAMSQLNLSARAYHRILKLARTIADLAEADVKLAVPASGHILPISRLYPAHITNPVLLHC